MLNVAYPYHTQINSCTRYTRYVLRIINIDTSAVKRSEFHPRIQRRYFPRETIFSRRYPVICHRIGQFQKRCREKFNYQTKTYRNFHHSFSEYIYSIS